MAHRVTLWCTVLRRSVTAELEASPTAQPVPSVPAGWTVAACLDRAQECYGLGCCFTTDGGEMPFDAAPPLQAQAAEQRSA